MKVRRPLIGNTFAHQICAMTVSKRKEIGVRIIKSRLPVNQLENRHRLSEWQNPNQFHAMTPNPTTFRANYATMTGSVMQVMATSPDAWHQQQGVQRSSASKMCQTSTATEPWN